MKNIFRKIYYFPLQPWFVKIIGLLFLKKKENKSDIIFHNIYNILVVKVDEIGDFVLSTPFLRELRKNYPNARITLIVKEEIFNLAEYCPYVDEVLSFNLKMNKIFRVFQQYYRMVIIGSNYFWKQKIDLAIIPRWDGDDYFSAFIAYFSGAKNIVGYNQKNGTEKLLSLKIEKVKIQHEVQQNLDIIKYIDGQIFDDNTELWLTNSDKAYALNLIGSYLEEDKIIISLVPGASKDKKKWPVENFILLMKNLSKIFEDKILFILLGSKDDIALGKIICNEIQSNLLNCIGITTLRQAAGLLNFSEIYVGNDSGLMHIAASMNVSVISIFCHPSKGKRFYDNSPFRFGPWTEKKNILQPAVALYPCKDYCKSNEAHCIKQVKVEEVFESVKNLVYSLKI